MDIRKIRKKVRTGEYDLSEHAHKERQTERITIEEIETTWITWNTRAKELKSRV